MIAIMSWTFRDCLDRLGSQLLALGAGQFAFHRGDAVVALHVVERGAVHLLRHQEDGSHLVLQKAGPGAILAEASLFSSHYHCDAVAAAAAEVRVFAKAEVRHLLAGDPAAAEAWADHLARELQRARLHAEILSLRTVARRLDAWLGLHGGRPERGDWKLVAGEIGVTPEALYRELAKRRG